jgi:protein-tyrosine phosphatase
MVGDEKPEFGLYLLGRQPPPTEWESRWIPWPDFRLPRDPSEAVRALVVTYSLAADHRVEVACAGGHGRAGTALACMATLAGLPPRDAVAFVRRHYDRHAVETPFQKQFVHTFARLTPR